MRHEGTKGRRHEVFMAVVAVLVAGITATLGADQRADGSPPARPEKLPVDATRPPLKIAFISYANPQQVARDSETICRYLEPYLGLPVKGFVTTDYASSIEAMRYEQADMAFVDPLAFMMAHEQIGARPLLLEVYSSGKPAYHSCVWVRRDAGIETLSDLKGKTIAFADQVDMSGHLLPRELFVAAGLMAGDELGGRFFKQVYFAGGDEQAIRAVLNGFVDAAGISQFSYMLLLPQERDQVTVIAKSVESPSHLVMARRGLPESLTQRFTQALLALDPKRPQDKAVLEKLYGVEGFVPARLCDFAQVAEIAARYGFVKNPKLFAEPAP